MRSIYSNRNESSVIVQQLCAISRSLVSITTIILVAIALLGTAVFSMGCFNSDDGETTLYDEYMNTFNKSETHNDITLKVQTVFSDGLSTYIRICVDGEIPLYDDSLSIAPYMKNQGLLGKIQEALLSDETGTVWSLSNQVILENNGVMQSVIKATESDPNECVLVYHDTRLSGLVSLSLDIRIAGIEESFYIQDLETRIAPVTFRDYSSDEVFFDIPNAEVQILSATSTYLNTILKLKFTVVNGFMQSQVAYNSKYLFEFKYGTDSKNTFTFLASFNNVDFSSENVEIIGEYALGFPLQLDKEITLNLIDMTSKGYVQTLCVIPSKQ